MSRIIAAIIMTIGALGAALITAFKEDIKSYLKGKRSDAASIISISTILQVPELSSNQDEKPLSTRKRPFDTKIRIEKAEDESSFIFYLPSTYQGVSHLSKTVGKMLLEVMKLSEAIVCVSARNASRIK